MSDGSGNEPMPEEHGTTPDAWATEAAPTGGADAHPDAGHVAGAGAQAPWWSEPHTGGGQWSGQGLGAQGAGQELGGQGPYGYGHGGYSPGQPWGPAPGGAWGWGGQGGWGGPPTGGSGPRGSSGTRKALAAGAAGLVTLAAVAVGVGIGYGVWNGGTTPAANYTPHTTRGNTRGAGTAGATSSTPSRKVTAATGSPSGLSAIAKKVDAGLVDVNTVLGYDTEEAAGTGMVLTSTGEVLTNNHVIEGSTNISVNDLGNGKTYHASVLGYDKTQDVAVIQLKGASGLTTVKTGSSSNVTVGEPVVGIGNAGGSGGTPSVAGGSVSGLNRAITASDEGINGKTVEHLMGLIETNCDIKPGDSGGPLVDKTGAVLGMDTAASAAEGYSFSGATTGQGYSIPIDTALSLAHQIMDGKASAHVHIGATGFLGVYVRTVSSSAPTHGGFGFGGLTTTPATVTPGTGSSGATGTKGAFVTAVIGGTPAQQAGLAKGDVITSVAGTTVTSSGSVTEIMMQHHPGNTVKVVWTAPTGSSHSATVTLGVGPAD
ncbi:MAG: S1C family serine protease [Acidimicrobiales bacterium]